jgi:hydroxyacylglutathione hydrolase
MHTSLGRFNGLDDETLVLCGHEYTQSNAKFCLAVEPDSADLRARAASIDELRAQDLPTVPSTLGEERKCLLPSLAATPLSS